MLGMVGLKRVVDYAAKIRVSQNAVDWSGLRMSMNPFCEIAMEEGIRLKERGVLRELIAVSVGPDKAQETLRQALAMGADRAILLKTDVRHDLNMQPLAVAKLLRNVALEQKVDLVLLGKQAIDDDGNQTGQLLAGLLDWPQSTQISKLDISSDGKVEVVREVDEGLQKLRMSLPAVLTCDLRLNQPRYATLGNIMKAKKKSLKIVDASTLGIDILPRNNITSVIEPPKRQGGGVMVSSVDELLSKLREEAKLEI